MVRLVPSPPVIQIAHKPSSPVDGRVVGEDPLDGQLEEAAEQMGLAGGFTHLEVYCNKRASGHPCSNGLSHQPFIVLAKPQMTPLCPSKLVLRLVMAQSERG